MTEQERGAQKEQITERCHCRGCNPMNWPETNGWKCKASREREARAAKRQGGR